MVEPIWGGIIGVALLLVFLFMGAPIFVGLGLSGMIGLFLIEGFSGVFLGIASLAFEQVFKIGWLAVPLFIFMGNLVVHFGLGADLYDSTNKLIGRLPGGLAVASAVMSGLFGFVCGSGLAGAATIGTLAIPEMEKKGYSRRLSLGTLALAGSIAALIPPSVLMIIYAAQTMTSMGAMFLAGIFPGILLVTLISVYVGTICFIKPQLGPKGEKFTVKEKAKSLIYFLPTATIFVSIIGGIYMGIWAPMEAGATACLIVTVLSITRVSWEKVRRAALSAAETSVMIYTLMIGATILSSLFYISGLNDVLEELVTGLPFPNWGIILFLMFIMMIMGMFMDVLALLLISLPITFPIIINLGYEPVWWGILMIVSVEMSLVTPPVGINLFIIHGVAPKGTKLVDVIWGAVPFVALLWVFIGLLLAFPDIVMLLPNSLMAR